MSLGRLVATHSKFCESHTRTLHRWRGGLGTLDASPNGDNIFQTAKKAGLGSDQMKATDMSDEKKESLRSLSTVENDHEEEKEDSAITSYFFLGGPVGLAKDGKVMERGIYPEYVDDRYLVENSEMGKSQDDEIAILEKQLQRLKREKALTRLELKAVMAKSKDNIKDVPIPVKEDIQQIDSTSSDEAGDIATTEPFTKRPTQPLLLTRPPLKRGFVPPTKPIVEDEEEIIDEVPGESLGDSICTGRKQKDRRNEKWDGASSAGLGDMLCGQGCSTFGPTAENVEAVVQEIQSSISGSLSVGQTDTERPFCPPIAEEVNEDESTVKESEQEKLGDNLGGNFPSDEMSAEVEPEDGAVGPETVEVVKNLSDVVSNLEAVDSRVATVGTPAVGTVASNQDNETTKATVKSSIFWCFGSEHMASTEELNTDLEYVVSRTSENKPAEGPLAVDELKLDVSDSHVEGSASNISAHATGDELRQPEQTSDQVATETVRDFAALSGEEAVDLAPIDANEANTDSILAETVEKTFALRGIDPEGATPALSVTAMDKESMRDLTENGEVTAQPENDVTDLSGAAAGEPGIVREIRTDSDLKVVAAKAPVSDRDHGSAEKSLVENVEDVEPVSDAAGTHAGPAGNVFGGTGASNDPAQDCTVRMPEDTTESFFLDRGDGSTKATAKSPVSGCLGDGDQVEAAILEDVTASGVVLSADDASDGKRAQNGLNDKAGLPSLGLSPRNPDEAESLGDLAAAEDSNKEIKSVATGERDLDEIQDGSTPNLRLFHGPGDPEGAKATAAVTNFADAISAAHSAEDKLTLWAKNTETEDSKIAEGTKRNESTLSVKSDAVDVPETDADNIPAGSEFMLPETNKQAECLSEASKFPDGTTCMKAMEPTGTKQTDCPRDIRGSAQPVQSLAGIQAQCTLPLIDQDYMEIEDEKHDAEFVVSDVPVLETPLSEEPTRNRKEVYLGPWDYICGDMVLDKKPLELPPSEPAGRFIGAAAPPPAQKDSLKNESLYHKDGYLEEEKKDSEDAVDPHGKRTDLYSPEMIFIMSISEKVVQSMRCDCQKQSASQDIGQSRKDESQELANQEFFYQNRMDKESLDNTIPRSIPTERQEMVAKDRVQDMNQKVQHSSQRPSIDIDPGTAYLHAVADEIKKKIEAKSTSASATSLSPEMQYLFAVQSDLEKLITLRETENKHPPEAEAAGEMTGAVPSVFGPEIAYLSLIAKEVKIYFLRNMGPEIGFLTHSILGEENQCGHQAVMRDHEHILKRRDLEATKTPTTFISTQNIKLEQLQGPNEALSSQHASSELSGEVIMQHPEDGTGQREPFSAAVGTVSGPEDTEAVASSVIISQKPESCGKEEVHAAAAKEETPDLSVAVFRVQESTASGADEALDTTARAEEPGKEAVATPEDTAKVAYVQAPSSNVLQSIQEEPLVVLDTEEGASDLAVDLEAAEDRPARVETLALAEDAHPVDETIPDERETSCEEPHAEDSAPEESFLPATQDTLAEERIAETLEDQVVPSSEEGQLAQEAAVDQEAPTISEGQSAEKQATDVANPLDMPTVGEELFAEKIPTDVTVPEEEQSGEKQAAEVAVPEEEQFAEKQAAEVAIPGDVLAVAEEQSGEKQAAEVAVPEEEQFAEKQAAEVAIRGDVLAAAEHSGEKQAAEVGVPEEEQFAEKQAAEVAIPGDVLAAAEEQSVNRQGANVAVAEDVPTGWDELAADKPAATAGVPEKSVVSTSDIEQSVAPLPTASEEAKEPLTSKSKDDADLLKGFLTAIGMWSEEAPPALSTNENASPEAAVAASTPEEPVAPKGEEALSEKMAADDASPEEPVARTAGEEVSPEQSAPIVPSAEEQSIDRQGVNVAVPEKLATDKPAAAAGVPEKSVVSTSDMEQPVAPLPTAGEEAKEPLTSKSKDDTDLLKGFLTAIGMWSKEASPALSTNENGSPEATVAASTPEEPVAPEGEQALSEEIARTAGEEASPQQSAPIVPSAEEQSVVDGPTREDHVVPSVEESTEKVVASSLEKANGEIFTAEDQAISDSRDIPVAELATQEPTSTASPTPGESQPVSSPEGEREIVTIFRFWPPPQEDDSDIEHQEENLAESTNDKAACDSEGNDDVDVTAESVNVGGADDLEGNDEDDVDVSGTAEEESLLDKRTNSASERVTSTLTTQTEIDRNRILDEALSLDEPRDSAIDETTDMNRALARYNVDLSSPSDGDGIEIEFREIKPAIESSSEGFPSEGATDCVTSAMGESSIAEETEEEINAVDSEEVRLAVFENALLSTKWSSRFQLSHKKPNDND